jgi:hypothetical protein
MTRWTTRSTLRWMWIATVLATATASTGCERKQEKPAPSCAMVTEHVYEITRKAYPGHGDMQMGNRKDDIARCEARKMSAEQRRCMVAAQSMEALAQCARNKADEKKPDPREQPRPGTAPAPAATPPAASPP